MNKIKINVESGNKKFSHIDIESMEVYCEELHDVIVQHISKFSENEQYLIKSALKNNILQYTQDYNIFDIKTEYQKPKLEYNKEDLNWLMKKSTIDQKRYIDAEKFILEIANESLNKFSRKKILNKCYNFLLKQMTNFDEAWKKKLYRNED